MLISLLQHFSITIISIAIYLFLVSTDILYHVDFTFATFFSITIISIAIYLFLVSTDILYHVDFTFATFFHHYHFYCDISFSGKHGHLISCWFYFCNIFPSLSFLLRYICFWYPADAHVALSVFWSSTPLIVSAAKKTRLVKTRIFSYNQCQKNVCCIWQNKCSKCNFQ